MKQPVSHYTSMARSIPQMVFAAVISFTSFSLLPEGKGIFALAITFGIFFLYSYFIRYLVASDHRKGMSAYSKQDYDAAIEHFERSFTFFSNHRWLEKYGCIIFMMASVWSYREIALINIAAAYSMKKETKKYREANEKLLEEYPENKRGKAALEFLDAMKNEA